MKQVWYEWEWAPPQCSSLAFILCDVCYMPILVGERDLIMPGSQLPALLFGG